MYIYIYIYIQKTYIYICIYIYIYVYIYKRLTQTTSSNWSRNLGTIYRPATKFCVNEMLLIKITLS